MKFESPATANTTVVFQPDGSLQWPWRRLRRVAMATTPSLAVTTDDVTVWGRELDRAADRIDGRFARREARDRARAYLKGLLSPVPRKNAWQLAEQAGDPAPY